MGGISNRHVEWAIVNRLRAMLIDPPETPFNVTQTYALFSAIVLWTKQRMWAPDHKDSPADRAAQSAKKSLGEVFIIDAPWLLSVSPPNVTWIRDEVATSTSAGAINQDFAEMSAEKFVRWLRDALAHGDGRTVAPLHKRSEFEPMSTLLAGFEIRFPEQRGSKRILHLHLYHQDMHCIGTHLADVFCRSLSGDDAYFEGEASTAGIKETVFVA